MKLELYAISKRGSRDHNEDYCGYVKAASGFLACLADGLGGHAGGQTASRIAVTAALTRAANEVFNSVGKGLKMSIDAAQKKLLASQKNSPLLLHMRTTFTGIFIKRDGNANYAHVGDSRIYIFRDRKIIVQTLDHSVPQLLVETGNIKSHEIRGHVHRNQILHSLGDSKKFHVDYAPDFTLLNGDVILLCSDGFWEYVNEEDMIRQLSKSISAKRWINNMKEHLIDVSAGEDNDNYSALAIFIKEI